MEVSSGSIGETCRVARRLRRPEDDVNQRRKQSSAMCANQLRQEVHVANMRWGVLIWRRCFGRETLRWSLPHGRRAWCDSLIWAILNRRACASADTQRVGMASAGDGIYNGQERPAEHAQEVTFHTHCPAGWGRIYTLPAHNSHKLCRRLSAQRLHSPLLDTNSAGNSSDITQLGRGIQTLWWARVVLADETRRV